ncbi:hypothetical protein F7734_24630 [Scytonema sp. UIC 10036]|uniref:hypothetical protein n=1 Tax=Scytonema sp. UIC 10036 TaxID=2304196 RepID=UPI0012DA856B|nr:hypothetical protein [Scytonema sp. UIC 10036]MUG95377.1 hypothetical protein [Scytonema sp. UIC 10036]
MMLDTPIVALNLENAYSVLSIRLQLQESIMGNQQVQTLMTNQETCHGRSLQIMQLFQACALRNNLKLLRGGNLEATKVLKH